jgi:hypothetical protein
LGHQCIDAKSACAERHHKKHPAHHREVSKEGRSVNGRVAHGPVGMENKRKRKCVKCWERKRDLRNCNSEQEFLISNLVATAKPDQLIENLILLILYCPLSCAAVT